MKDQAVKITERGWAGHYICADRCKFRRNTLVEYGDERIVVSTVGALFVDGQMEQVGDGRYYETMAFGAANVSFGYVDADISDERRFDSQFAISAESAKDLPVDVDNAANAMHDAVVAEFVKKLQSPACRSGKEEA